MLIKLSASFEDTCFILDWPRVLATAIDQSMVSHSNASFNIINTFDCSKFGGGLVVYIREFKLCSFINEKSRIVMSNFRLQVYQPIVFQYLSMIGLI